MLLSFGADPFIYNITNFEGMNTIKSDDIKAAIKKARKVIF